MMCFAFLTIVIMTCIAAYYLGCAARLVRLTPEEFGVPRKSVFWRWVLYCVSVIIVLTFFLIVFCVLAVFYVASWRDLIIL